MAATLALLGIGIGCDTSEDDVPVGTTTTYYGTYVDPVDSGVIDLTGVSIPMTATRGGVLPEQIPVNGELRLPGQTITLVGSYDTDTGYLAFASDDESYTFTCIVAAGQCSGVSVHVTNGQGAFALFVNGSASNVTAFCGTAQCDPGICDLQVSINLAVSGGVALLTASVENAGSLSAAGTISGPDVNIHIGDPYDADIDITGTITGSSVSGTWVDHNSTDSGTWSGSTAQCSSVAMRR